MTSARSQNMQKRRHRILSEARRIIAEQGFDAFNLRDLAELSELTVPTVYNLIGNKDEILKALILGTFADFEQKFREHPPVPASALPATITDILIELVAGQEDYFRATGLASERIENPQEILGKSGVLRTSLAFIADNLCRQALKEKLLTGSIRRELLVEQMGASYQLAFRDWAHRIISLEELRRACLRAFYITLAADATPAYRETLIGELKNL